MNRLPHTDAWTSFLNEGRSKISHRKAKKWVFKHLTGNRSQKKKVKPENPDSIYRSKSPKNYSYVGIY